MKKYILSLIVMFAASTTVSLAQDDMYFVPKKETKEERAQRIAEEKQKKAEEQARKIAEEKAAFEMRQRAEEDMMVRLYRRIYHEDVDIYNRHFTYENPDTLAFDSLGMGDDRIMFSNVNDTLYNVDDNYKYLQMISRFDDIMLDLDRYSGVPTWFYPWYSSPTHINWAWTYHSPRFHNPFYSSWYGGIYDPWYYGYYASDPWWYSWYDPWYDRYLGWGGYYGDYYGWGGYYGYRPYYEHYYVPNYGYVGHHHNSGHYGVSGGGNHGSSNVSVSKWGVRTKTNNLATRQSGNTYTYPGMRPGSNDRDYGSYSSNRSSSSSPSYSSSSSSSYNYSSGNSTTTRNSNGTYTTFTPTTSSSSYSSGSSYSGGSSRSSSSSSYSSGGGGYSGSAAGARGAGGRR